MSPDATKEPAEVQTGEEAQSRKAGRRVRDDVAEPAEPISKYRTILADPPWSEVGGGKICRGAQGHYPVMKTDEIIKLMRRELDGKIDTNAHLYLWVTNNFLPDGIKVMQALGFVYKTIITWNKVDEYGKGNIGLGQYYRGVSEQCLFGVKGCLPYRTDDETGKRLQGITAFYAPRQEHSRKPDFMYEMIEKVSYAPRLEMFARFKRTGWDAHGNEVADNGGLFDVETN